MFNELKITNNGDNTYSLSIKDYVDKSMKKYDIEADKLKEINFDIDCFETHGGRGYASIPIRNCNFKVSADFFPNKDGQYYRMLLKEEPKNVTSYNDVIDHLNNGKELIFTKSSGVLQRFRVNNGNLQDYSFNRKRWEDRTYFPQWSDLTDGKWAVVI